MTDDKDFSVFYQQYGKYTPFVIKWLYASPDFAETQSRDFRVQGLLHDMDELTRQKYIMGGSLFSGLPKKSRIVYALYYGDGISIPELAGMFRITPERVEKMAMRVREALQTEERHLKLIHQFVKPELRLAQETYDGALQFAKKLYEEWFFADEV